MSFQLNDVIYKRSHLFLNDHLHSYIFKNVHYLGGNSLTFSVDFEN